MTTLPRLPVELYAEILTVLDSYQDRSILLSAALVSKEWRKHSQRIIFSRMTDYWLGNEGEEYKNRLVLRHTGFLRAIAEHPSRLGPLVHTYMQHSLSVNPAVLTNHDRFPKSCSDLWNIMVRALPAMINLKHLTLRPLMDSRPAIDNYVSSSALLRSFTFQLKTLAWGYLYHPESGLLEFISRQKNIIHLEGDMFSAEIPTCLDDSVCPGLISRAGNFTCLYSLAQSRKIRAWRWYCNFWKEKLVAHDTSVLCRLKYLSLASYSYLREIVGTIDLNITLLEILGGTQGIDNPPLFSNMPMLRVIVLIQNAHITISNEEISQIAIASFNQLPSLQHIIQRDRRGPGEGHRYLKLTLSPNPAVGILREELTIDYGFLTPWWANYDV